MPSEPTVVEWWLAFVAFTFFLKGAVFAALAWTIWHEHRQENSRPTRIGRELQKMFLSITGTSFLITAIFCLSWWAVHHRDLPPLPDWFPWAVRVSLLVSPALVVIFGLWTFRSVRDEARYRARNGGPLPRD